VLRQELRLVQLTEKLEKIDAKETCQSGVREIRGWAK